MNAGSVWKKPQTLFPLLALFSILAALLVANFSDQNKKPEKLIKRFSHTLNENYKKAQKFLTEFPTENISPNSEFSESIIKELPEGFSFYLVHDTTLLYWSDNDFPFNEISIDSLASKRIIRLSNGYYQIAVRVTGEDKLLIAGLIKHEYPYDNDYLLSKFGPSYKLPITWNITDDSGGFPVKGLKDETLFRITPAPVDRLSPAVESILFTFYQFAFICLIIGLYYLYRTFAPLKDRRITIFLFTADVMILRGIIQYFRLPAILDETELFNAYHYASSAMFPSLGDLYITVTGLLVVAVFIYKYYTGTILPENPGKPGNAGLILTVILTIIVFFFTCYLIETIWVNSTLQLDFSKILEFNFFSFIGFFIIALSLISLFLISFPLLRDVYNHAGGQFLIVTSILSALLIQQLSGIFHLYSPDWMIQLLFLAYLILLLRIFSGKMAYPKVIAFFFFVLILTSVSSYSYYKNRTIREKNHRKLLAVRLTSGRDKIAEYLFSELEPKIMADSVLRSMVVKAWTNPASEPACAEYLEQNYFRGAWSKYHIQITLCYPDKELNIKPSNYIVGCYDYFDNIIRKLGDPTDSGNFHYISETFNDGNYIARLPLVKAEQAADGIYAVIEFMKKYAPKGMGYPELLLDRSQIGSEEISNYSWAIYQNNDLVRNVGEYSYSIYESAYRDVEGTDYRFFVRNGYNHLYHKTGEGSSIIISKKADGVLDILAPFTYQITFHFLLVFLIFAILWLFRKDRRKNLDLSTRLQVMLILLLLFASALIGITILENIKSLNTKKNRDMLSEKAHSVLVELEQELSQLSELDKSQQTELEDLLIDLSQVFFTDINLYTPSGTLLASSRPQIFDEGLKSKLMNSQAYRQLAVNKRTLFITNEQIGNYEYLSAYIPFRNNMNVLTAYVNLPYFARQQELRNEISAFLVALINIYVILTATAVIISLLIGSYLTRPLQLIREKFSRLNLGESNEKIEYRRRDELGNLINEYNNMIEKLAESAEKLARSERESAWREMARQVAHEIKNPLTPMKLSIQHLIKARNENAPDWDKRFAKTSETLIMQIDSLSAIATAFSDFARLPQPDIEKVDVAGIIRSTIGLFTEHPDTEIVLDVPETPCYVYADEKQLSRAFINLLNNSLQAIPAGSKGKIVVSVTKDAGKYIIRFIDNGAGISEEQKASIFSPNFTTKSGGMGLGLAMVKNIVDSAGGSISFTSGAGDGTTFTIELPAAENK